VDHGNQLLRRFARPGVGAIDREGAGEFTATCSIGARNWELAGK
jgi:hypothetical protein